MIPYLKALPYIAVYTTVTKDYINSIVETFFFFVFLIRDMTHCYYPTGNYMFKVNNRNTRTR